METPPRMPLQDLPLEKFLAFGVSARTKTPRKHKRPLSPSQTTLLNPAKRRVLDTEGVPHSSNVAVSSYSHTAPFMHTVTPTRPSRLGNGLIRSYVHPQGTLSLLPSCRRSPFQELYPKPAIESSTDPQSRHYPGFDIFPDSEHRRGLPAPGVTPSGDDPLADRCEEDKENMPLRKRAKKPSSKKRLSSGLDGSDASCSTTHSQTSKVVVRTERTPLSTRQALR